MKLKFMAASVAVLSIAISTHQASAKPRHHHRVAQTIITCDDRGCSDSRVTPVAHHVKRAVRRYAEDAVSFLSHPTGCPRIAFCACGAAVDLWGGSGRQYKGLWAAAAWYRFQRSSPSHNTVAVRRHHVMVLKSQVSGKVWMVADYNSGGHRSRLHARSIVGYTIVDPERPRIASK